MKIVNGEFDGASLANSQNNGVHESTSGSGFHKPFEFVRKGIFAHSITRRMFTTFKDGTLMRYEEIRILYAISLAHKSGSSVVSD